MAQKVVMPIAQGFEEIEAVTVIDILRRAGVDVVVAGVSPGPIIGRNGIRLVPDCSINDVKSEDLDMVILPGGAEGTERMLNDAATRRLINDVVRQEKYLGAICAAPTILSSMGLLKGKRATSHPSVEQKMADVEYRNDRVVVDGRIVTSRSPGTAMEFAMALVEILVGKEKVEEVNRGVLAKL